MQFRKQCERLVECLGDAYPDRVFQFFCWNAQATGLFAAHGEQEAGHEILFARSDPICAPIALYLLNAAKRFRAAFSGGTVS